MTSGMDIDARLREFRKRDRAAILLAILVSAAACDRAFKFANREGEAKIISATECVAESAARMGMPDLALPHHEGLFGAYAETLRSASDRHRLANNYGVLLIEAIKRVTPHPVRWVVNT